MGGACGGAGGSESQSGAFASTLSTLFSCSVRLFWLLFLGFFSLSCSAPLLSLLWLLFLGFLSFSLLLLWWW